jgi:hypothetical protein
MRAQVEAVKSGAVPAPKRRESRMEKEKRLEEENSASNALERLSMMVAVRVGENVGIQFGETQPSEQVHLTRGSAYGEDGHPVLTEKELPRKGYFELNNKSKEFCCVKVLRKGGDQKFEVPRPSYLAGRYRFFSLFHLTLLFRFSWLSSHAIFLFICIHC